jgi:hypothetical protein
MGMRQLRGEGGDLQLQLPDGRVGHGGGQGALTLLRQGTKKAAADAGDVVDVIVQERSGEACGRDGGTVGHRGEIILTRAFPNRVDIGSRANVVRAGVFIAPAPR